jgi:hypothetical protein
MKLTSYPLRQATECRIESPAKRSFNCEEAAKRLSWGTAMSGFLLTYLVISLLFAGLVSIFLRGAGRDFHAPVAESTSAAAPRAAAATRRPDHGPNAIPRARVRTANL